MSQWNWSRAAARCAGTTLAALATVLFLVGCESTCPCKKKADADRSASPVVAPSAQLVAQAVFTPTPDDPPKPENDTDQKPPKKQDKPQAKDAEKSADKPEKLEKMDRDALIELIKKRAAEYDGRPAPPRVTPHTGAARKPGQPAVRTPGARQQVMQKPPTQRGAQKPAARKGGGCKGGSNAPLTPPPPDQPQPKYVCEEPVQKVEDIWKGSKANFKFTFKNEGAAPLALRVRRG